MGNTIVTPSMGMPNPVPGVDPGPDYAQNIQTCFNILDQHNHSPPNGGVQINPSGININSPLPFNGNQATGLGSILFNDQTSLATLNALYTIGSDLWYNDSTGPIQITLAGAVNATSSGISSGTASASFSSGVLIVNSAVNTAANIQVGSVLLGNTTAGSNFVTLSPPSSTPSYALTLPLIPAATSFMTLDTSGNMAGSIPTANGITRANLAPVGEIVSLSCGTFLTSSTSYVSVTNLTVTITTTGRPVVVGLTCDGVVTSLSNITNQNVNDYASIQIVNGSSPFYTTNFGGAANTAIPSSSVMFFNTPTAGTYTYFVRMKSVSGGAVGINYSVLYAYEL
jgi:hypothetical protein